MKKMKKVLSLAVAIVFFVNNISFGLSAPSASHNPDTQRRMYHAAEEAFEVTGAAALVLKALEGAHLWQEPEMKVGVRGDAEGDLVPISRKDKTASAVCKKLNLKFEPFGFRADTDSKSQFTLSYSVCCPVPLTMSHFE